MGHWSDYLLDWRVLISASSRSSVLFGQRIPRNHTTQCSDIALPVLLYYSHTQ